MHFLANIGKDVEYTKHFHLILLYFLFDLKMLNITEQETMLKEKKRKNK